VRTICDLCGEPAEWPLSEAPTTFKVKGKPLRVKSAGHDIDLCATCLTGILADGRVMPVRWSNAPFFGPGVFLGFLLTEFLRWLWTVLR